MSDDKIEFVDPDIKWCGVTLDGSVKLYVNPHKIYMSKSELLSMLKAIEDQHD